MEPRRTVFHPFGAAFLALEVPFQAMKTSLIGLPFLWSLVAVTVVLIVGALFVPGAVRRTMLLMLGVIGGLVSTAAWVNHHYAYLPDVGAVLGRRAVDQASAARVAGLAARVGGSTSVPLTHGLVERLRIPAPASGFSARPAQVYLPPAWFRSPRPRLPVIELLHGTPGTPEDWTRAGHADVTADRWATAHGGMAPVIVMPDPNGSFTADSECVNGRGGRAETFLSTDVPDWVVATFGTATDRRSWAIAGSSEGGFCALDLALHHPDRYATFLDFSGLDRPTYPGGARRLLGGSSAAVAEHTALQYLPSLARGTDLAGWFEVGSADGDNTLSARRVASAAAARGIETHVVIVPHGAHNWRIWERAFIDAFPWTAQRVGLSTTVDPLPRPAPRTGRIQSPRRETAT